jgi:uncharacterized protein GlcG (DUF336 family)
MKRVTLIAAIAALSIGPPVQAAEVGTVTINRLTMETTQMIANAAVDACRDKGIQIGVTVVDRDGIPQAVLRDTIGPTITLPISKGKAYAAVMFGVPTSELSERANTPVGRTEGVVMSAGGLPIQIGGALLGAVGVSGAPSGETDQECAQAGIDAVKLDLEMAM